MADKIRDPREKLLPPLKKNYFTLDPGEETLPAPLSIDPEDSQGPMTLPCASVSRRSPVTSGLRDSQERRGDPRVPLKISCEIQEGIINHQTQTLNASLGGFCVEALDGISLRLGHLYQIKLSDGQQRSRFRARLSRLENNQMGFIIHTADSLQERLYNGILLRCAYQNSPTVGALFRKLLAKKRQERDASHDG